MLNHVATVRPTRHRLAVAMGVAAGFVALLLFVVGGLVSFGPGAHGSRPIADRALSLLIKQDEAEMASELETVEQPEPPVVEEIEAMVERASVSDVSQDSIPSDSLSDQRSPVDWTNTIANTVVSLANEKQDREEVRESMWRQTHSVMFQQTNEFVPKDERPVLANLNFKPEIHVVGLGVTIGSCFVGLPLVGVPVEERTVAIRLFVCADDSG